MKSKKKNNAALPARNSNSSTGKNNEWPITLTVERRNMENAQPMSFDEFSALNGSSWKSSRVRNCMRIDPNRYHWRALIIAAVMDGHSYASISRETGICKRVISSYAAHASNSRRVMPGEYKAQTLIDYFKTILEPNIIRVCSRYDVEQVQ